MTLKLTILGCGSSGGVPRIGGNWGACDPNNLKNKRLRCSVLVEKTAAEGNTTILIDTSTDCRQQLLAAGVGWLDGVFYTHDHADHTHGIDELRMMSFNQRSMIDVYHNDRTGEALRRRFSYCFNTKPDSNYKPILSGHEISAGDRIEIKGAGGVIAATPYRQIHGNIDTFGFRMGGIAYSPDVMALPEESLPYLEGLDVLIIDALRYEPHPCHFNVEQALEIIERFKPKRAVLTHMHDALDYDTLAAALPAGVEPAFDGMVLEASD
jgi:phosphoribosyl 1,2-cyclic phosphate phosphodiesterase